MQNLSGALFLSTSNAEAERLAIRSAMSDLNIQKLPPGVAVETTSTGTADTDSRSAPCSVSWTATEFPRAMPISTLTGKLFATTKPERP